MDYNLYTWPHCEDCEKVKQLLDSKKIEYNALSLFNDIEAKKKFGYVIRQHDKSLKKTLAGKYVLPVLAKGKDGNIEKVVQGYEDIKSMFD